LSSLLCWTQIGMMYTELEPLGIARAAFPTMTWPP
jgi:hypothetical protein